MRPSYALWACAALLAMLGGLALIDQLLKHQPARSEPPTIRPADRHVVSPQQLVANTDAVPVLSGTDQDGARRVWTDLSYGKPVVVVFVKHGCPCSVEFEPYFHRLVAAYPDSVRFVAVIDGGVPAARRFATENHVPYPVLADESKAIIQQFRAGHGAAVVLLSASGQRETQWPGCSREMMRDLGARIARLGGVREEPVDVAGLPGALTAGCSYSH